MAPADPLAHTQPAPQPPPSVPIRSLCVLDVVCVILQAEPQSAGCTMGRMHSNGKGMSASAIPYRRAPPGWLKREPSDVCDQI